MGSSSNGGTFPASEPDDDTFTSWTGPARDLMSIAMSVVVVAYDMARELPRTLKSLSPSHQRSVEPHQYEIVVVDNGSPEPVALLLQGLRSPPGNVRVERIDPAPPSPAMAANRGLASASGPVIGLVIDGARIASPGLLAMVELATRLNPRPVITAPAYHLGTVPHGQAAEGGYDEQAEDRLLSESGWEQDGYRLFAHSTLAGSSGRGWFGPMGESSSLFMPRALWDELGGLDERFVTPGGGLVNHDLYERACALPDAQLVVVLGEGTFHQQHGGAATSRRYSWDDMHAEYQALRGRRYRPPGNRPLYIGRLPEGALGHLETSARLAIDRRARRA